MITVALIAIALYWGSIYGVSYFAVLALNAAEATSTPIVMHEGKYWIVLFCSWLIVALLNSLRGE